MKYNLQVIIKSVLIYIYLTLSLWWNLTTITTLTISRWMPKSFFQFEYEKTAHNEFLTSHWNLFEAITFSLVALPGYLSVLNFERTYFNRRRRHRDHLSFGNISTSGGFGKYLWISLTPWLITYAQGWTINVGDFLRNVWSAREATTTNSNDGVSFLIVLLLLGLLVQSLLWIEIFLVAMQGWVLMHNENIVQYEDSNMKRKLISCFSCTDGWWGMELQN